MLEKVRTQIHHFFYTLLALPRAWQFMVNYRLWVGLRQYGWVARALVILGVILGLYVVSDAIDWFGRHRTDPLSAVVMGEDSLLGRWFTEAWASMSDGTFNMITLVLLEVVIYHFMRRTLAIVLQRENKHKTDFKPFLNAQVRMLVMTLLTTIFTGVVFEGFITEVAEEFGLTFILPTVGLFLHVFFLGFLIADNYNEQFDLTINQSWKQIWRHYIGISLGLGLPLWLMLKVPIVGTILGPLAVSVTAAIVMRELTDLHLVGYRMSAKEQEKAEKKAAKKAAKAAKKAARRARRAGA